LSDGVPASQWEDRATGLMAGESTEMVTEIDDQTGTEDVIGLIDPRGTCY